MLSVVAMTMTVAEDGPSMQRDANCIEDAGEGGMEAVLGSQKMAPSVVASV